MDSLLKEIKQCTLCAPNLPLGPNPVVRAAATSKINIIGQAPGTKVHHSGIPWDDASGKQLRQWLGVDTALFYDEKCFAIVPMGFCYPGKGTSGDLPPRPECAPTWHPQLLAQLTGVQLTLLIGQYAQKYYLGNRRKKNLTETVRAYKEYLPNYFVLPHPSPRNRFWQTKNPWFQKEVVPQLQQQVSQLLAQ